MRKLLSLIFSLLFICICSCGESAEQHKAKQLQAQQRVAAQAEKEKQAAAAQAKMDQLKPGLQAALEKLVADKLKNIIKGGEVKIYEMKPNYICVYLTSPQTLRDMQSAEIAARNGIGVTVDYLMNQGLDPNKQRISIICRITSPAGLSPTGKPQVRFYGEASYDYNYDRIEWDEAR